MRFRMVAPPEVEEEGERLYAAWQRLPRKTRGSFEKYRDANCSEAARAYMRECEEIRASLQPGEHV